MGESAGKGADGLHVADLVVLGKHDGSLPAELGELDGHVEGAFKGAGAELPAREVFVHAGTTELDRIALVSVSGDDDDGTQLAAVTEVLDGLGGGRGIVLVADDQQIHVVFKGAVQLLPAGNAGGPGRQLPHSAECPLDVWRLVIAGEDQNMEWGVMVHGVDRSACSSGGDGRPMRTATEIVDQALFA